MNDADRYAQLRLAAKIRERPLLDTPRVPDELELQARWFAGDFGSEFLSTAGERIRIVQFGTWNRGAGPDFSDAAIRIGDAAPMRGSIELELLDRNWETHGHGENPAFEDTVLHVFVQASPRAFWTKTLSNRNVPQVLIDPAGLHGLPNQNLPLARSGRCQAPLHALPEARVQSVLEGAARFRLQRKTARLRRMIEHSGRDETLYQEIAAALGYRENKLAFTLLAQRLPLALLRHAPAQAEALLFGLAGFLNASDLGVYDPRSRSYVRELWHEWWPHRDELQRLILPVKIWNLAGVRPLNHPQRRLAALAEIARHWKALMACLGSADPQPLTRFFLDLEHPFWNFHYTLTSAETAARMALVGATRITDMLANIFTPLAGAEDERVWSDYKKLPAKLTNRRLETACARLFADDSRRASFLKTVAHQQGLLQIYEDFCLQDNSDCAQCPFPEQMLQWP